MSDTTLHPSRRLISFVIAAGLGMVACSGSASSPSAADFAVGKFSVRGGLDTLIVPPSFEDGERIDVRVTDLAGAAAAVGVDIPAPRAGYQESEAWITALFGNTTIDEGGTGLRLDIPMVTSGLGVIDQPELVIDEFGWSPLAITSYAEITQFPVYFTAMAGDLAWTDDVIDLGNGVGSIGEGADFERSLDNRTDLRPIGRPVRTGARGGLIAASLATPAMASWVAGESPTLLDDDRFAAAAAPIDDADAVHADLIEGSFGIGEFDTVELSVVDVDNVVIGEPFDVVGLGVSVVDGRLVSTIVYVFADDDAAERAVEQVDAAWDRPSPAGGDFRQLIDVGPAERRGRTVVVSGPIADDAGSAIGRILASNRTAVFLHR